MTELKPRQWSVGDIVRLEQSGGGTIRVWRVVGVFLGGTLQEDVVELETLDRWPATEGRLLVPNEILTAAWGSTSL